MSGAMSPMLYVLVFASALLALEGLYFLARDHRRRGAASPQRRLRQLARSRRPARDGEQSILRSQEEEIAPLLAWLRQRRAVRALELKLYRAGAQTSLSRFTAVSVGLALAGLLGGTVLFADPVLANACAGLGLVPWFRVRQRHARRMQYFERQFPEAVDLLIRALRAGHALSAGFEMVAREFGDPVGTEFGRVADEIRLGQDLRVALADLSQRVDCPDLPFFVTAIAIQRETGSNLADLLSNLSAVIRERLKLYGKIRSLTSMARTSANVLAASPFLMTGVVYLLNPSYVAPLWESETGHVLLMISSVLVVVGYLGCREMSRVRV